GLVVWLGRARLQDVAVKLIAGGRSPSTPVAVIESASTARQRVTRVSLAGLGAVRVAAPAPSTAAASPALVVVGEVARLARSRASGPLAGRSLLLTRPAAASAGLAEELRRRGAEVLSSPLIRIAYRRPRNF